ncbi:MAG: alanine--tRNA ligase [Candidatus Thorarchaeota archaeon]
MSSDAILVTKMLSDKEIKKQMKQIFHKNFEKYYPTQRLTQIGFQREICKNCGRGFWTTEPRKFCDDSVCSGGYRFINKPLTSKRLTYRGAWEEYCKIFKQWDYRPIKRYPVVARWYDELAFTAAGINAFQPYIVKGEQDPPYQRVLEPQMCLRFNDLDNVGITGTHYSAFIMVGQHVFNNKKLGESFWMEDGIEQIYTFIKNGLGINPKDIVFHEDIWAGGGNFGPSIEFFSGGIELGNQVYIQYDSTTMKQLDTRVIDMGAGLERWSWFCSTKPTSYETTFPNVLNYIYKNSSFKPNADIWKAFMPYAGWLNVDETEDVGASWKKISGLTGLTIQELEQEIYPIRAIYAIADHTRNLLFAIKDGGLPSNVGGGYNLRNILRRCFSLIDEYQFDFDFYRIFELHIEELGNWFPELKEVGSLYEILDLEKKRYTETLEKNKKLIKRLIKEKKSFDIDTLVDLYDSQGVTPELVKKNYPEIKIPHDFYHRVQERHESKTQHDNKQILMSNVKSTKQLYYEETYKGKLPFKAVILDIVDNEWLILDQTHFYPEGGGQVADTGKINNVEVKDVQISSGIIFHKMADISKFKLKQKVTGQIDWSRRYNLMKLHSGTHLVNAVAKEILGNHIWQAGAKKSPRKAHLDITHYKNITPEELELIEKKVNYYISEEPIESHIKVYQRDKAEEKYGMEIYQGGAIPSTNLRIVSFKDDEACSGTHLKSTSEIGFLKIISAERIQDGIVRLSYEIGQDAVERVQKEEALLRNLSSLLKGSFDDLPKKGQKIIEEWKQQSKTINSLQQKLLETIIEKILNESQPLIWLKLSFSDQKLISEVMEAKLESLAKYKKSIIAYIEKSKTILAISGDKQFDMIKLLKSYSSNIKEGKVIRAFQVERNKIPNDAIEI